MKKILTIAAVIAMLYSVNKVNAQVSFHVGIGIGTPVIVAHAAPVYYDDYGYNNQYYNDDEFYYYPDYDMYYDVVARQYVYFDAGRWIFAANLPRMYRDYDFAHARRFYVNEARPFARADYYRNTYRNNRNNNYYNNGYAYNNGRVVNNRSFERGNNGRANAWGHEMNRGRGRR